MLRRKEYQMEEQDAWALLKRAPSVQVAGLDAAGQPVLRALHAIVEPGLIAFHGAPAGEKTALVGGPAVIGCDEIIAEIPSYWTDPQLACPATTFFLGAQAHGVLEPVVELDERARLLDALMRRYQPEGGHAPITAADPRYLPAIKGLLIFAMRPTRVEGKAKLGQNRKPAQLTRLAEQLWARGRDGDPRAIELILAANPDAPRPGFLCGPAGVELLAHLDSAQIDEAVGLLAPTYWCADLSRETLRGAFEASGACVGARRDGRLVACARAVSDRTRRAWIYDVVVDPALRGQGVGRALMQLLLNHPVVRGAYHVRLGTRDAASFYEGLGFVSLESLARPVSTVEMLLSR